MSDYNRYQKMIINTLARKLGPAAGDFADDMARKSGTKLNEISPANIENFACNVEKNVIQFISPAEAQFVANTIRRLKA